ncbi:DUF805 domain-containing protein [Volucribacter amazonae]|uniref:DUF805 domain-containing protein n=1 Tax=Volucribacter amazonae TaxID=256731 RepID=A0A9X4P8X8_9PAST|nr:DUF805 domain-containing protein [Volucribacter amazonae]MDG6894830.1 hypothetical protein [Volucribacter amazonae]
MLKKVFWFLFGFKGRISRLHFTLFLPFLSILFLLLASFFTFMIKKSHNINSFSDLMISLLLVLFIAGIYLLIKYSHIVRRIHDFDKKANESLLFIIIFLCDVISFFFPFLDQNGFVVILRPILAILSIICIISLCFIKGSKSTNSFDDKTE